ncbi:MAG: hypothetical protein NVS1B2_22930 [Vulcanimicrobiaceae bacterium]
MRAVIHELRNHLTVAMCGIESFLDRKLEPTDGRLGAILQSLREVDLLIDGLPRDRTVELDMHPEWIDVCRLVATHVSAMEGYAAERGVRLTTATCERAQHDDARFYGDPGRIAEIVTNVTLNAIKYSPPGNDVHVDCRRLGDAMQFTVSDAGPGIGPAERGRLFERGYRGRTDLPGSGIGLALVKQFVDRQGGTIDVSDSPLGGATFTVRLPGVVLDEVCATCGASRTTRTGTELVRTTPSADAADEPAPIATAESTKFGRA